MAKFKVGDIVTGINNVHYQWTTDKATMRVVETYTDRPDGNDILVEILSQTDFPSQIGKKWLVYSEHFKLIKGEIMSRKTFRLKKNTATFKKGLVVQEACDDGTQEYVALNHEDYFKFSDFDKYFYGRTPQFTRESVEQNPEWFEEVFPATEAWLTSDEKEKLEKYLKSKEATKKDDFTSAPLSTYKGKYSYLFDLPVGGKKTIKNEDVLNARGAMSYLKSQFGYQFTSQRANKNYTTITRVA